MACLRPPDEDAHLSYLCMEKPLSDEACLVQASRIRYSIFPRVHGHLWCADGPWRLSGTLGSTGDKAVDGEASKYTTGSNHI